MVEIKNLAVSYNSKRSFTHALGPINLSIDKGDIYAIIGPSGCGKSTLLKVLSGIINKYEGHVLLQGKNLNPKIHNIGIIPQGFGLLQWKTVMDNCLTPLKIKGVAIDNTTIKNIDYIMKKLDIETLKHRYPNELSGGQRQRAAIARAFIMNPDILLMDEPFSALDALTREDAQQLFINMWNQYKTTTVFVTHSIDEAIYMGKKIIIMSKTPGTIVEIIDNPLFNIENLRENHDYIKLSTYIRNIIKRGWKL
jgi:ABC-type nitrate/sulfonate/bicarbonate transport system ATPase subunit